MKSHPAHWYVFYTKAQHEKRVCDRLAEKGFEVFLPLMEKVRIWSDRKKKIEVPIFPNYIFVKIALHDDIQILTDESIVRMLRFGTEPAKLSNKEMERLKKFSNTGFDMSDAPTEIRQGDRVKVIAGPLKGMEGICKLRESKSLVYFTFEGIQRDISVQMPNYMVKIIKTN